MLDIRGGSQTAILQNWEHRHGTAKVICHEHELAGGMNAGVGRTRTAGGDRVERRQLPILPMNRESAHSALLVFSDSVGFIGGIESSAGSIESQAIRAGSKFIHTAGSQSPGSAVHAKRVTPAAPAGGQIHL